MGHRECLRDPSVAASGSNKDFCNGGQGHRYDIDLVLSRLVSATSVDAAFLPLPRLTFNLSLCKQSSKPFILSTVRHYYQL